MNVIISDSVRQVVLSVEESVSIKLIANVDFSKGACAPASEVGLISRKLQNFLDRRSPEQYARFMEYYHLYDMASKKKNLQSVADNFKQAHKVGEGLCVDVY